MSRRANAAVRCPRCVMHASLCVCSLIPRIVTRTRVVVLIHRNEHRKPTNTGRLAAECLVGSRVLVRGRHGRPEDQVDVAGETRPLLLFPHEGARDLREFAGPVPVTLIVPDGTWRQASKVKKRVRGMDAIPSVTLPLGAPSRYRLRLESHDDGLATMEALARALGILEGPSVEQALLAVFAAKVERTLWSRGELDASEVTLGIPPGVERHDPTSGLGPRSPDRGPW
jgi:DTW domain-containing protein